MRRWTAEEMQQLCVACDAGLGIIAIGRMIGRSSEAVANRLRLMNLKPAAGRSARQRVAGMTKLQSLGPEFW